MVERVVVASDFARWLCGIAYKIRKTRVQFPPSALMWLKATCEGCRTNFTELDFDSERLRGRCLIPVASCEVGSTTSALLKKEVC